MSMMRTAVLASALVSSALVSTAGLALADERGGDTVQNGFVNSSDFAPNTPVTVCNNDVPANALGVQVPVQDNATGLLPLGSEAGDGSSAGIAKSCKAPIHAIN